MQYMKTFESFDQDPDLDPTEKPENKSDQYIFFIHSKENEDMDGEVKDVDGKTICNVDQSFIDDGIMQYRSDVTSLREYLIKKKKIRQQDELTIEDKHVIPKDTATIRDQIFPPSGQSSQLTYH